MKTIFLEIKENISVSQITYVLCDCAHPENSFFESKKNFFNIRSKKEMSFELKKVLLI